VLIFRAREGANLSDVSTTTMMTATTKRRSRAKAMQPSPHRRPPPPAFRPASKVRKLTRDELQQMLSDAVRRTAAMGRKAS
jgi:hypothetical protein